jgi:hypothetical protein
MNALYYYDPDTDQMKAVLVDPPLGYKDDTDYQLRNLAHKAEGEARKARDAGRNWDADYFAALAARYHKQAAARYRPTVQPHLPPADPLPVRIAIALIVAVFAAFAIGWIIGLVIA